MTPQTLTVFLHFELFYKPSDDVRQVVGINRDNFKHFGDTPGYKFVTFDIESSDHFPIGGAVSGGPILDLGAATIDPTFVYAKQDARCGIHRVEL